MTLVVSVIDPDGVVVMGADTSERVDSTPSESEDCLCKVEFRRRSKLRRVNDDVYIAFWGETTRIDQIVSDVQKRARPGDVDEVAEAVRRVLEDHEAKCDEVGEGHLTHIGFLVGGHTDQKTGRLYRVEMTRPGPGAPPSSLHFYMDPEPDRYRFMYGGEYSQACATVRLLGDLVEYGLAEVGAGADNLVRYLIQRTASYVLATTRLPLVGGHADIVTIEAGAPRKIDSTEISLPRQSDLPFVFPTDTPMPTGSVGIPAGPYNRVMDQCRLKKAPE